MRTIYQKVRDLREIHNKTQADIATLLHITIQQYSLYETGKREFKIKHIQQLCTFYNISADYLLGLPDLPYPKKG